jgi:glyoxylase-like metal-dependent hydrolase (beta-lactamase superfamily II)
MIRLIVGFYLLSFAVISYGQNLFADFSAEKISKRVYVIHGPLQMPNPDNKGFINNPAFIVADKSVIVVDPGSSQDIGRMLMREIRKVTDKPVSHIFNTHIHGDHWLANDAIKQMFPEVIIIAGSKMIKKARGGDGKTWIEMLENLTDGATAGTKIAYPNKSVKDMDRLIIAGLNFNIHSIGVAHSDSDIMIELVEDSLMFTGDNVAYQRILRMDGGSFRDSILACDRAISLQLKHYVPGHGKTGDINIVKLQKEYFHVLYTQVGKYYEQGLEDFEMKPMIVKSLQKFQSWRGFKDQIGRHISLAVLETEKAEFE